MRLFTLLLAATIGFAFAPGGAQAQSDTMVIEDRDGRLIVVDRYTHEFLGYAEPRRPARRRGAVRRPGSLLNELLDVFGEPDLPPRRPSRRRRVLSR